MSKKQLFAKVGIVVLLGLNGAAYYFFWPDYRGGSAHEAKVSMQEKGEARLAPAAPAAPAEPVPPTKDAPKFIPPAPLLDATPIQPSEKSAAKKDGETDLLGRLLDHIKQENQNSIKPPDGHPTPPAPLEFKRAGQDAPEKQGGPPVLQPTLPGSPRSLPPLNAEPLGLDRKPSANPGVAVAPPLTPKAISPWMLHTDRIGNQTQLIAKLRHPTGNTLAADFRILCDRLETKSSDQWHAIGRVTIVGAGFRASCERLTLPLLHARLLFEEQVQLVHDGHDSFLRCERLSWELPAPIVPTAVLGRPN